MNLIVLHNLIAFAVLCFVVVVASVFCSPWVTIAIGVVWACGGLFAHGVTFAYFQNEYPRYDDRTDRVDREVATCASMLGPIGLLQAWVLSGRGRHGVKFFSDARRASKEAS